MQRVNVFPFYQLGSRLHTLANIAEGDKVKDWRGRLYSAQTWLDYFINGAVIPLNVSIPAAQRLLEAIKSVLEPVETTQSLYAPTLPQPATIPVDRELTWIEAYNVRNGLQTFETVLGADLDAISTYFVSPKLGYDTRILIENASSLLPSDLQPMPEEATSEFLQLGKCIAFDISTAAAFHTIRATEAVIRKYYEAVIGRPPKPKMRNWGAYIKNLEKCGAEQKITGFLDHIRENYRNPVLHPEETLSPEEAQILLGVCTSAIIMMAKAMRRKQIDEEAAALTVSPSAEEPAP